MSYNPSTSLQTIPVEPPEEPFLAELAEQPRESARSRWFATLIVSLFVCTVGVMFVVWALPGELQLWRLAAAEEQRLNGDHEGAMRVLEADIQRNPRDIELRYKKAQWLLADNRYDEALVEVEQIIEWHPTDVTTAVNAYMLRSRIFHATGEHKKAVDDCKRILEFDAIGAGPARAEALNGLAYARGLANIEIDQGLTDITEAIRMTGENFPMLDTRGYLYYRKGDFDRALKDLDLAVTFAEDAALVNAGQLPIADRRYKKLADQAEAEVLAVIHYHRGLVHQARNNKELAEADFQRVRELGFEPSDALF